MAGPSRVLRFRSLRFVWETAGASGLLDSASQAAEMSEDSTTAPSFSPTASPSSHPSSGSSIFAGWGAGLDTSVAITVLAILSLITLSLVTTHLIHSRWKASVNLLPEAAVTILVGIVTGGVIQIVEKFDSKTIINDTVDILKFDPVLFLVLQLPPIIFNSGYNINRTLFLANFTPIFLFAVIGTIISTLVISVLLYYVVRFNVGIDATIAALTTPEICAFAALISATDPVSTLAVFQQKRVDLQLFYLVFGESVLNDAVGIVLFDSFSEVAKEDGEFNFGYQAVNITLIFIFSLALGMVFCVLFAQLFRRVDLSHNPLVEMSVYVTIMYFPFVLAECLGVSGIVTILFTAMFAQRYVAPNVTAGTLQGAEKAFRMFAHLSETSIFLVLGMAVVRLFGAENFNDLHLGFFCWTVVACLLGRAANIYGMAALYNFKALRHVFKKCCHSRTVKSGGGLGGVDEVVEKEKEKLGEEGDERVTPLLWKQQQQQQPQRIQRKGEGEAEQNLDDSKALRKEGDGEDYVSDSSSLPEIGSGKMPKSQGASVMTSGTSKVVKENKFGQRIPYKTQNMLCFAGLRGAVAFACALNFPTNNGHQEDVLLLTMMLVLVTVFLLGSTTSAALDYFEVETGVDENEFEIEINDLKIRFIALTDRVLSRWCLDEEHWPRKEGVEDGTKKGGHHQQCLQDVAERGNVGMPQTPPPSGVRTYRSERDDGDDAVEEGGKGYAKVQKPMEGKSMHRRHHSDDAAPHVSGAAVTNLERGYLQSHPLRGHLGSEATVDYTVLTAPADRAGETLSLGRMMRGSSTTRQTASAVVQSVKKKSLYDFGMTSDPNGSGRRADSGEKAENALLYSSTGSARKLRGGGNGEGTPRSSPVRGADRPLSDASLSRGDLGSP